MKERKKEKGRKKERKKERKTAHTTVPFSPGRPEAPTGPGRPWKITDSFTTNPRHGIPYEGINSAAQIQLYDL